MSKQFNYKDHIEVIKNLLDKNKSITFIGKVIGVKPSNLRRYLINNDLIKLGRWVTPHSEKTDEVLKLYQDGYSVEHIRNELKVSYHFIRKLTDDLPRPKHKTTKGQKDKHRIFLKYKKKIIHDYLKGVSIKSISKYYEINWRTLRNRLMELGLHDHKNKRKKDRITLQTKYRKFYENVFEVYKNDIIEDAMH